MGTGFVWDWRPRGCSASSTFQHWLRSFSGKEAAALLFVVLFVCLLLPQGLGEGTLTAFRLCLIPLSVVVTSDCQLHIIRTHSPLSWKVCGFVCEGFLWRFK